MSPRSTPAPSYRRRGSPSYMHPTKASEARARQAVSPKPEKSSKASSDVTPGSMVSAHAAKVEMAVAEGPQVRQVVGTPAELPKLPNQEDVEVHSAGIVLESPLISGQEFASETTTISTEETVKATVGVTGGSIVQVPQGIPKIAPLATMVPMAPILPANPVSTATKAISSAQSSVRRASSSAEDSTPESFSAMKTVSKKRKRPEGAAQHPSKIPKAVEPTIYDAGKEATDKEPVTKKRKTRSQALSFAEFLELGSDSDEEDNVAVPQRKRKATSDPEARVNKATKKEPKPSTKYSLDPEVNRIIKAEEKRKAAAANANVFARNPKLRRSLADVTAASRMSRRNNRPTTVEMAPAPMNATKFVPVPIMKDSSSAIVRAGAVTYEDDVTIADLRTIKYINPTANVRMVHIDRIVQCPYLYPNVHIDFDEHERPTKAHITKMTDNEFKFAAEAAIGRHKEKVKLDAKLARQNKGKVVAQKNPTLHKGEGSIVGKEIASGKSTGTKTTEEFSKRKVGVGKTTEKPPSRKTTASKVPFATSTTKKGTATKTTPNKVANKSPLNKVASGRVTRQSLKSGSRS